MAYISREVSTKRRLGAAPRLTGQHSFTGSEEDDRPYSYTVLVLHDASVYINQLSFSLEPCLLHLYQIHLLPSNHSMTPRHIQ